MLHCIMMQSRLLLGRAAGIKDNIFANLTVSATIHKGIRFRA
jgi:hypothetical protein